MMVCLTFFKIKNTKCLRGRFVQQCQINYYFSPNVMINSMFVSVRTRILFSIQCFRADNRKCPVDRSKIDVDSVRLDLLLSSI